ncbi:MAG: substrate-binding domain-containing protein [Pseudomonadota bacterium]
MRAIKTTYADILRTLGTVLALSFGVTSAALATEAYEDGTTCVASGPLKVATSHPPLEIQQLTRMFATVCPQVDVAWLRSSDARILREQRSDDNSQYQVDVIILSDATRLARLIIDDRLVPLDMLDDIAMIEAARGRNNQYIGISVSPLAIVMRDDGVPPTRWLDLPRVVKPDRIAIPSPSSSDSARTTLAALSEASPEIAQMIRDVSGIDNGLKGGHRDALLAVLSGQADAALSLAPLVHRAGLNAEGLSTHFPEDGVPARVRSVAIMESVDNRPAAEEFVRFLLSRKAQAAMIENGYHPVRIDLARWQVKSVGYSVPLLGGDPIRTLRWLSDNADFVN